jgi:hypothetical protein
LVLLRAVGGAVVAQGRVQRARDLGAQALEHGWMFVLLLLVFGFVWSCFRFLRGGARLCAPRWRAAAQRPEGRALKSKSSFSVFARARASCRPGQETVT